MIGFCTCKVHINKPTATSTSFRVLKKYSNKFIDEKFTTLRKALEHGLINYKSGFRIFKQNCFEWYEPTNILIMKIENVEGLI